MKTFNIRLLVVALVAMVISGNTIAQIKRVDISATGLTCSMCSNAIYKQLESMPQVAEITTDLNTNTFTVLIKEGAVVQPVELRNAVEKAGFFVGSMQLTMNVDAEKMDANSTLTTPAGSFVFIDEVKFDREAQYRVLDKGFITQKEYRALAESYATHPSYLANKQNNYHLSVVKQ